MRFIFTLFAALISCTSSFAQVPEKEIVKVKEKFTPEGLYFHLDKEVYIAGETIWFKCYVTESGLPSTKSTVLYVELLNDSGRVISKKILPVIGSAAIGEFESALELKQGNYIIRAYTQRLLSFGPGHFHEKSLQIINPYNAASVKDSIVPHLYFLPEGGNMIAGLPAVVAFRASDQFGRPIEINGQISDEGNLPVIEFATKHWGMGKFVFIPQSGKKYTATCNFQGKDISVPLPAIAESGVSLNIQLNENGSKFIINTTKVAMAEMQPAYLLGIANNETVFKVVLPASANKLITGELPLQNIASGILQLTLFTAKHQPLAERMLFINHEEYLLSSSFSADTLSYNAFQKNKFRLSISDTSSGTYSVSVTDAGKDLPVTDRENIVSRIFLQNHIKGYIHNPLYYFTAPFNFTRQQQLDLVMLTSGWRRYNWDEILNNRFPSFSNDNLNYISFSGKFFEKGGKKPASNSYISLNITSKDSANEFFRFVTDSAGMFRMNGLIFTDTAKFSFQHTSKPGALAIQPQLKNLSEYFRSNYKGAFSPVASIPKESPLTTLALGQSNAIKKSLDHYKMLQEVELVNTRKINKAKIVEDRYATGLFNSGYGKIYDFVNNPSKVHYRNVFEYLKVNGTGINISNNGFEYFVNFRMTRSLTGGLIGAALFLDGFPVDASTLASIPLQDIALIKTYSSGFAGAESGGAGGAVAVFTRKGNDRISSNVSDKTDISIEGFSPTKDFFSPDYSEQPPSATTDKRSTLYWNPYLSFSSANPEIQIPFYNADNNVEAFRIIITGMNSEGKLLYVEKIIK